MGSLVANGWGDILTYSYALFVGVGSICSGDIYVRWLVSYLSQLAFNDALLHFSN